MNERGFVILIALFGLVAITSYVLGYHGGFSARDPHALDTLATTARDLMTEYQKAIER